MNEPEDLDSKLNLLMDFSLTDARVSLAFQIYSESIKHIPLVTNNFVNRVRFSTNSLDI